MKPASFTAGDGFAKALLPNRAEIAVELTCDEWVQYRQGTDTRIKTHSLHEAQLPTHTVITGEHQADYEHKISISAEETPSFLAEHNQVRWRLVVNLKVPGIPAKCQSEFLLQVLPEMLTQ